MSKTFGRGPANTGRIQRQIGTKVKISKDQSAEYTEIWAGMFDDLTRQTPTKDSPHPVFRELLLTEKEIVLEKLGRGKATLVYRGLDPAAFDGTGNGITLPDGGNSAFPEVDLEVDTDVEEVPIQAHPNFAALVAAAGAGKDKAYFNPESGLFEGFGPQSGGDLAGVESYLVPRVVTTRHWYSDNRANLPVGVAVSGGLRTTLRSTRQGRIWKNTEVIRAGNPNPLIY